MTISNCITVARLPTGQYEVTAFNIVGQKVGHRVYHHGGKRRRWAKRQAEIWAERYYIPSINITNDMSDDEIRDRLREIDESEDCKVTSAVADFLESILYRYDGPLSDKQRDWAIDIINEHQE